MNTEQERTEFEAWAEQRGMELHKVSPCDGSPPYYIDTPGSAAWKAWQARAALAAQAHEAAPQPAQPADEELRRDALQNLRKELSLAVTNARELFHSDGSMFHEGRRVAYEQCLAWIDAALSPEKKENSND